MFEFLSPGNQLSPKKNNQSCVLKVTSNDGSLLITGDIEKEVEKGLVANQSKKLTADILIVPHHGSKTSSSSGFIGATAPRWAVFSAGYRSQFNHPHPKIVQRYENLGINTLNTADTGMLSFLLETPITPVKYRDQKLGYW